MARELEPQPHRTPVVRRAVAGLVLVAVAALVVHFAIGLITTVVWIIVAIAAVAAVIWALKTI